MSTVQSNQRVSIAFGDYIVGTIAQGQLSDEVVSFYQGHYDQVVKEALYQTLTGKMPETEDECETDEIRMMLTKLKLKAYEIIHKSWEQIMKRVEEQQTQNQFRNMNAVDVNGTVAEISEYTGLSKKKVRKMRQEGTLQEYIDNME